MSYTDHVPRNSIFSTKIKRWGIISTSISAIIGLVIFLVTQVWPLCVSAGLGDRDELLRDNTRAVKKLANSLDKMSALLDATIKTASDRGRETDLNIERLRGSVEALRNEVRLRHGVLDLNSSMVSVGTSSNPNVSGDEKRLSRRQQVKEIVKQADERVKEVKVSQISFKDAVEAKMK